MGHKELIKWSMMQSLQLEIGMLFMSVEQRVVLGFSLQRVFQFTVHGVNHASEHKFLSDKELLCFPQKIPCSNKTWGKQVESICVKQRQPRKGEAKQQTRGMLWTAS